MVVGSEYQDTKIQRMVHFFLCRVEKEVGILNPTFTMLFKYKGQLLVGAVTNDVVLIFTGHFLTDTKKGSLKYIRTAVRLQIGK